MNSIQVECIQNNFQLLTDCLDPRDIIDCLYQQNVINADEVQEYGENSGGIGRKRKEGVRSLLILLQNRPKGFEALIAALTIQNVYRNFADALLETEKQLATKAIKDDNLPNISSARNSSNSSNPEVRSTSSPNPHEPIQAGHQALQPLPNYPPPYYVPICQNQTLARSKHLPNHGQGTFKPGINLYSASIQNGDHASTMSNGHNTFPMDYPTNISLHNDSIQENDSSDRCPCMYYSIQTYAKSTSQICANNNYKCQSNYMFYTSDNVYSTQSKSSSTENSQLYTKYDYLKSNGCDEDEDGKRYPVQCSDSYVNTGQPTDLTSNGTSDTHSDEDVLDEVVQTIHQDSVDGSARLCPKDFPDCSEAKFSFLNELQKHTDTNGTSIGIQCSKHYHLDIFLNRHRAISQQSHCSDYDADSESDDDTFSDEEQSTTQRTTQLYQKTAVPCPMIRANMYQSKRDKRLLSFLFDELSLMINRGEYSTFLVYRDNLLQKYSNHSDLKFLLLYLTASFHLWKNEYEKCETVVEHALKLLPQTTCPSRALVQILSSRCWMYFQDKKFNKLHYVEDEALQTIFQDPVDCAGMATGWIYINKARLLTAVMGGNDIKRILRMRKEAVECLKLALQHFRMDESRDGPFGCGFARIMLASVLFNCGDRMHTVHIEPAQEDIDEGRSILTKIEDSPHGVPGVLLVHLQLAKCDYYLRLGMKYKNRSAEQARQGLELATQLSMTELQQYANIRLHFLTNDLSEDPASGKFVFADTPVAYLVESPVVNDHKSERNISNNQPTNKTSNHYMWSEILLMLAIVLCLLLVVCLSDY